jgi:iron complex transport system substrate-binding protein
MQNIYHNYWILYLIIILFSCNNPNKKSDSEKIEITDLKQVYAQRFQIEKHDFYTRLIIINPWQGAKNVTQEYFLIKRGNPVPEGISPDKVIFTPLEKIVCTSTTHIAMISALHSESTIAAVSGAEYVFNDEIRQATALGRIKDVGYEDNLNMELILELAPDLVMVYGIGNESMGYLDKLNELGIKVLFNADYLETDPLGKTEWIKVIGALYNKEMEADSVFNKVAGEYNILKSFITDKINTRPAVLLGLPWKDTWFISPGNSYISKLIKDAGGNYLWSDTESDVSMPFGLENVFLKALNADYWMNIGNAGNKDQIIATDARLSEIAAYKKGRLYNNNNRVNDTGGNDYWESGSMNPQFILHDMAVILHPELFNDTHLYYYKHLE